MATTKILATFANEEYGIQAEVAEIATGFSATLKDTDAGEFVEEIHSHLQDGRSGDRVREDPGSLKRRNMSVTFYIMNAAGAIDRSAPDLNVNHRNAAILLGLLGVQYDQTMCGEIPNLAELERACLDHLNVLRADPSLDAGREPITSLGAKGCLVVECQMVDGYLTNRLTRLREMAEYCLLNDGKLVYA